eukprot:NODE_205_length_14851_cov_0.317584.p11 type:complete len:108 gc:universal NODE_205_length_14851_cov_0.317584:11325-11002(-)
MSTETKLGSSKEPNLTLVKVDNFFSGIVVARETALGFAIVWLVLFGTGNDIAGGGVDDADENFLMFKFASITAIVLLYSGFLRRDELLKLALLDISTVSLFIAAFFL